MIKALFLDFYGTVVHEDGAVIDKITTIIKETGDGSDKLLIGRYWWKKFQELYMNSYNDNFQTQRVLETKSLEMTLNKFSSNAEVNELSEMMVMHWRKPPIFEDAKPFFSMCEIPIYIVSNIDAEDIMKAIKYHNLKPIKVFTSEDAKSYKPRKELFEMALRDSKLKAHEVIHIGDSLSSDVKGASELGINTIWLNRSEKETPSDVVSVSKLVEVFSTSYFD